jgi:TP901 family phage tail tape measure protein
VALGARDVFIIMRARDEASRSINTVGRSMRALGTDSYSAAEKMLGASAALIGIGSAMATVGAAGTAFFAGVTKDAAEFSRQSARTLTQTVGRFDATVDDMKNIARRVAREIPAPFEEMQETLYFIFSSTNANISEAEELLKGFSKEAVAGQAELAAVARSSIAIMNAFGLPVSELERIQDMQFETVRKGVITYEELSSVIGRSIPATVRAGQDVEMLGASLAFLTRNGLGAEMASTSAARAFEAFARPAVAERLNEMGIALADAQGEFRPFNDVITDLGKKLETMSGPERAKALHELFKGAGGTIQARRFIDMAVKNYDEFNQHVQWQMDNAGAFQNAYNIMVDEPLSRTQALSNAWQVLRTEIGDRFLDAVGPVVDFFINLIDAWGRLSPQVQTNIIRFGALASTLMVLVGTLMVVTGMFLGFYAMMLMTGVSLSAILIPIGLIVAALLLLAGVGYLVYKNWDTIKSTAKATWEFVSGAFETAWDAIVQALNWAWGYIEPIWQAIVNFIEGVLMDVLDVLVSVWDSTWAAVTSAVDAAWEIVRPIWTMIANFIDSVLIPAVQSVQDNWRTVWGYVVGYFQYVWRWIKPIFEAIWNIIVAVVVPTFHFLKDTVKVVWNIITTVIKAAWAIISTIFQIIMAVIKVTLVPTFEFFAAKAQAVFSLIAAAAKWAWENVIKPVWHDLQAMVQTVLVPILEWLQERWAKIWAAIASTVSRIWNGILNGIKVVANSIIDFIEGMINSVINGINALVGLLNKLPGVEIDTIARVSFTRVGMGGDQGGVTNPTASMYFHQGGYVEGGDARGEVDAKLLSREGVVNRRGMTVLGKDGLELLNRGTDIFRRINPNGGKGDFVQDFFNLGKRALERAYGRYIEPRLGSGNDMFSQVIRSYVRNAFDKVFDWTEETAKPELGSGVGWQKMWEAVSTAFSDANLHSAYRPGAITATGNPSYHGMGRAIDITPSMKMFNWIAQNYGSQSREIIFSPAGQRQIRNGSPFYYTGVTRANHWGHIHWAMAQGGQVLRDGWAMVGENGPEARFIPKGGGVVPLDRALPGQEDIAEKLDQLIELLTDREPIVLHVETRDDPVEFARRSATTLKAHM